MERPDWTIGSLLRWTAEHFAKKEIESPRLDAEVLLAHVLNCRRIELYTRSDDSANDAVRTRFRALIERRTAGCPVAYLVGKKEFFLLSFEVSPAVLIPRPATETLVMAALERLKTLDAPRVVDIGTGSGCLAVSVAKHLKTARFVATDISEAAIELARRNAANNGVSDRIDFRLGDLFAPVAREQFDAIVSNPPYIPSEQIATLAVNVRDHEPRAALDGGPDGLSVIRRLVAEAAGHLTSSGWLLFEIGAGQESAIRQLIEQTPRLNAEKTILDSDGIPRVAVARFVSS